MHRCDIDWLRSQGADRALIHVANTVNALADSLDAGADAALGVLNEGLKAVFPAGAAEASDLDEYLNDPVAEPDPDGDA